MSDMRLYPCSRCAKALTRYAGGMCEPCRARIAGRAGEAEKNEPQETGKARTDHVG